MTTRKTMLPITVVSVIGLSIMLSTLPAYAQTKGSKPTKINFSDGLTKFIADEFHLDQNKVKTAVSTYKSQHFVKMQQTRDDHEKARLDQLVKDGKITQDQENAILAELSTLRSKYDPLKLKGMTPDQRKEQFTAIQSEIQVFAKANNIDAKYLMSYFGMRMRIKHGSWGMHKPNITITPSPTQ